MILLVQDGRILEQGSHDELLYHDGIYAKLHRLQFAEITGEKIVMGGAA